MNDTQNKKISAESTGKTQGQVSGDSYGSMDKNEKAGGSSLVTRIFAILGLLVIVGLYVLSLVASIADWENSFGIFTGALAATIFVPIVIYLFKLFSNRNQS